MSPLGGTPATKPPSPPPARRLPEPDFELIDYRFGEPSEQERAEWHDQWHVEHPSEVCDQPDRPRSSRRPSRWQRFVRALP